MTMRWFVRKVLRRSLREIRYVDAVRPADARGPVARVYAWAERDLGVLAPPLALHSPAPSSLAACWLLLRETLLAEGRVPRGLKELVATHVSQANVCPYCVDVHQAVTDTWAPVPGDPDDALAAWSRASARGGLPLPSRFSPEERAEVRGVALTFHYVNRMVGVFLADSPVPAQAPGFLRDAVMRTAARAMRPVSAGPLRAGASLDLLPEAPLPVGLEWAEASPAVARAVARAVAAVDRGGRWIPAPVREPLHTLLATWDRGPMGLGTSWAEKALVAVPREHRPAARLALLTAFAPYQVTPADIAAFRTHHPTDRELIELTSWSALTVAVTIGRGLAAGHEEVAAA